MISSTSTSGAEAPAVMPSVPMAPNCVPVDVGGALHQRGVRAAGALGDFLEPLRIGRVRRADHDHGVDQRGDALDRFLAVGGGVADVVLAAARRSPESARLSTATISAVSCTDSVVCVT